MEVFENILDPRDVLIKSFVRGTSRDRRVQVLKLIIVVLIGY